jgi:hypothetical protein
MVRKSPNKQWNRQNYILFHETIPLSDTVAKIKYDLLVRTFL